MKKILMSFLMMAMIAGCVQQAPTEAEKPEEPPVVEQPEKPVEQEKPEETEYVKKIDESKDWVYVEKRLDIIYDKDVDYYGNIQIFLDQGEMYVEYPVINIDSEDIQTLNESIKNEMDEAYAATKYEADSPLSKTGQYLDYFVYSSSEIFNYGNVYSLKIKVQRSKESDSIPLPDYTVYNINIETGKLLSNKELLDLCELSEQVASENFKKNIVDASVPICTVKENHLLPSDFCYYEDKTLPIIEKGLVYMDNEGNLMLIPSYFEYTTHSMRNSLKPIKLN